jgi:hypothetical protein
MGHGADSSEEEWKVPGTNKNYLISLLALEHLDAAIHYQGPSCSVGPARNVIALPQRHADAKRGMQGT